MPQSTLTALREHLKSTQITREQSDFISSYHRSIGASEHRSLKYFVLFKCSANARVAWLSKFLASYLSFTDLACFDYVHGFWFEFVDILLDSELNVDFDGHIDDEWRLKKIWRADCLRERDRTNWGWQKRLKSGEWCAIEKPLVLSLNWLHWESVNWLPSTYPIV